MKGPLEQYISRTNLNQDASFRKINDRQKSLTNGQAVVFREAFLAGKKDLLLDETGKPVPQRLVFSRIIYACNKCWGKGIADLIATHIFEIFYRAQYGFEKVESEIIALFNSKAGGRHSPLGRIERVNLPPIYVQASRRLKGRTEHFDGNLPLMVLIAAPAPGIIKAKEAAMNFINENNWGCGVVFLIDTAEGTKSIFKVKNLPQEKWDRFCNMLQNREPELWYRPIFDRGPAPYMLNGTSSHKELDRSNLSVDGLLRLLRKNFY
jgi:hypothetical protein